MTRALLVVTALALTAAPAAAQGKSHGAKPAKAAAPAVTGFTDQQHHLIAAYFAKHPADVKPLPPGIQRRLANGKPLPPGIAKRALPSPLIAELDVHTGFSVTLYGDRVVLLNASGLVVDVLSDIFH